MCDENSSAFNYSWIIIGSSLPEWEVMGDKKDPGWMTLLDPLFEIWSDSGILGDSPSGSYQYGRGVYYYEGPDMEPCYLLIMCVSR